MKTASIGGLVALVALAQPVGAIKPKVDGNCHKDKCTVYILVNGNTCGGGIAVSPNPIIVVDEAKPFKIKWKVVGDWEFDKDGIVLDEGSPIGSLMHPRGDEFEGDNDPAKKGTHKYDVNLQRKAKPSEKCGIDPTIVNH